MQKHFVETIGIPVISYSLTDPELSDRNAYPAFYRTIPSDNIAALAFVQFFNQFNWTSCIIIYQNNAYGTDGAGAISEAFNNNNLIVSNMIEFDIITLSIRGDLESLLTSSPIRIVILWAVSDYTFLILQNAIDYDVIGPQFIWILSSDILLDQFNQKSYDKLSRILAVERVVGGVVNAPINKILLNAAYNVWQQYESESFPGSDYIDYYALFAFDATWALIQSLQQFCSSTPENSSLWISFIDTSFCFDRCLLNSDSFYNIIDNIKFLDVPGSIQFSMDVTDRTTEMYYIVKNIQPSSNNFSHVPVLFWSDSDGWTSNTQANIIVWSGNSLIPPSGYALVSAVTLRIAVTETAPFTIVTQNTDNFGQTTINLVGYVPDLIDVLRNNMRFIPHIALVLNQSFDEIVDAVANGVYDIFVAQTTITATRSEIVGFSSFCYI